MEPKDTDLEYMMRRNNLIQETIKNVKAVDYPRSEPRLNTQGDRLIKWLEKGHTITAYEALEKFGIMRLASRIKDIKDAGYNIKSERVRSSDNKKSWARYSLEG